MATVKPNTVAERMAKLMEFMGWSDPHGWSTTLTAYKKWYYTHPTHALKKLREPKEVEAYLLQSAAKTVPAAQATTAPAKSLAATAAAKKATALAAKEAMAEAEKKAVATAAAAKKAAAEFEERSLQKRKADEEARIAKAVAAAAKRRRRPVDAADLRGGNKKARASPSAPASRPAPAPPAPPPPAPPPPPTPSPPPEPSLAFLANHEPKDRKWLAEVGRYVGLDPSALQKRTVIMCKVHPDKHPGTQKSDNAKAYWTRIAAGVNAMNWP